MSKSVDPADPQNLSQEMQFSLDQGILVPRRRPRHNDDQYDAQAFAVLFKMQREHFWYRGRHKLLLNVLKKEVSQRFEEAHDLRAIDMGGGCGGWLEYLHIHAPEMFRKLALGDSSLSALSLAETVVASFATRYHVDLLDLPWLQEWDVVFLLDVLEHIPNHVEALRQISRSLRPGALLFVTTPALKFFWTPNDDLVHHQRRYCRQDFRILARQADLELLRTEYFMWFLSPALFLSRILFRMPAAATLEQRREHLARTHRTPAPPINKLLEQVLLIEASMVNSVHFPWGTSVLAVFGR